MAGVGRSTVAVVTDTTSYLPTDVIAKYRIRLVPLQVIVDGRTGTEGIDVGPAEVAAALRNGQSVSTSQPSLATFAAAYREAARDGARQLVSIHISGQLSGTVEAARAAAAMAADLEIRVVDSRSVVMGLGFPAVAAAEAAAAGATVDEVERRALDVAGRTKTLIYVDTLEYLRRGGRIGAAASLLGAALAVKPLLCIDDGHLAPLDKVRTAVKALTRLVDLAVDTAGSGPVDVAVHHLAAAEHAARIADQVRTRIPGLQALHVGDVGAVVGAHLGPGCVLIVVSRR